MNHLSGNVSLNMRFSRWAAGILWSCVLCTQGKAGDVCGVITDLFGQPLAGATVQTVDGTQRSTTDSEGNYCLRDLPPGSAQVSITLRGFHEHRSTISVQERMNTAADFALTAGRLADVPPMSITGFVADDKGKPLGGARILAANCFDTSVSAKGASDEAGRFMIRLSEPGQWRILFWKPGYRAVSRIVVARPKPGQGAWTKSLTLRLGQLTADER